jgi:hypothetical protein
MHFGVIITRDLVRAETEREAFRPLRLLRRGAFGQANLSFLPVGGEKR